jgi:cellulose synthase/poly-beta-1,6-N-acetylglucosamine synthase-like glycosyltransferase
LLKFHLYDFLFLSFVQLILSTVLVLSPAREIGSRFRWTGSRITEVLVGGAGAVAISAAACLITHVMWGLPIEDVGSGAYVLVAVSVVVMALRPDTNIVGQVFYASYAAASATFIVYAAFIAVVATRSVAETATASFVILLDLAAFVVWMSNINYLSDVLCRSRRSRPLPQADPGYQPFVSLHIPAYNEPPDMLINTIKAVEAIEYPNFEIIVVDNNTRDPAVWRPVEEYCRGRARIKFVHVAPWPGYKAGACNLALRHYTDPRAEIIGLIDADDLVQPYYLRETVPYFSDPALGFVQTFEGNRDFEGSNYYTACVDSFQAFYLAVMSSRNERDSVPFVGTMGLFRRSALTAVGGWNEWCICEDTEASLRVAKDGWSGLYIPRCFGRGIVPPSFAGMLTQRHRWCFGAMQILRLHWRSLMPWDHSPDNHLTSAQRRDYLMASIGWFRDLLMLAFSLLLLAVTGLLATGSGVAISPLDGHRSLMPLSLIITATICMQWTLRHWTTMSIRRTVLSLVISLSVTWVVALGCIEGMARKDGVFLRTLKASGRRSIPRAVRLTQWETLLAVALFVSTGLLVGLRDKPWILIVIVFAQGLVYLCSPIASVWSLWAQGVPSHEFRRRFEERHLRAPRPRRSIARLPRRAAAAMTAVCVGGLTSAFLAPVPLLHATAGEPRSATDQALLAGQEVYLNLGTSTSRGGAEYYRITSVHLSTTSAHVALRFKTSSLVLLAQVLQAGGGTGRIRDVSLAFRSPDASGQPKTELVETFATADVSSFDEHLSGTPTGTVSLVLPVLSHVVRAPDSRHRVAGFTDESGPRDAAPTKVYVHMSAVSGVHAVTAVELSKTAARAPLSLSFATSSLPLLDAIFRGQGAAAGISSLRLSVRAGGGSRPVTTGLTANFLGMSVGSFAENISGSLLGTTTLLVRRH